MTGSEQEASVAAKPKRKVWPWLLLGACVLFNPVILGLAATLFVPKIIRRSEAAYHEHASAQIEAIDSALDLYHLDHAGAWPESLAELVEAGDDGQPYLVLQSGLTLPVDPWDRPYRYELPTDGEERPRVYSYGEDGQPGGEGADADIMNRR
jgi:general secretion pathway protein G